LAHTIVKEKRKITPSRNHITVRNVTNIPQEIWTPDKTDSIHIMPKATARIHSKFAANLPARSIIRRIGG
jgi:hypothetical protein